MPNPDVVELYFEGLTVGLLHPDGKPRVLPFSTTAMAEKMAEEVNKQTRGLAEAIAHHPEERGWTFVRTAELAELRAKADHAAGKLPPTMPIFCNDIGCECTDPLVTVTLANPTRLTTSGRRFIGAMHARDAQCPHGPIGAR